MKLPTRSLLLIIALTAMLTSAATLAAPRAQVDVKPVAYLPMIASSAHPNAIKEIRVDLQLDVWTDFATHCPIPLGKAPLPMSAKFTRRTANTAHLFVHVDQQDLEYKTDLKDGTGLLIQACGQVNPTVRLGLIRVDPSGVYLLVLDPTLLVVPALATTDGIEWVAPEVVAPSAVQLTQAQSLLKICGRWGRESIPAACRTRYAS